jgi:uncharacterized protein YqjF (DUF2071 family)
VPKPFLTAEWRDLVIVNYAVPASLLAPLVPRGTELDLWDGQALVSLVGFHFRRTRVLGVGLPGFRHFPEVNLRFYVRRAVGGEVRRAVVFVRELVPRRLIAWVARAWYNEPYRALPMRHGAHRTERGQAFSYEWLEPTGWIGVHADTTGDAAELAPGSKAEFITEHFWGYTRQRDGGTVEYQVTHPRWRVWPNAEGEARGDLRQTYGPTFGALLGERPDSAYVAVGSPVTVMRPSRLSR